MDLQNSGAGTEGMYMNAYTYAYTYECKLAPAKITQSCCENVIIQDQIQFWHTAKSTAVI